jgi:1-acyl-sn-glycerol-3-phosphate acyltransferase
VPADPTPPPGEDRPAGKLLYALVRSFCRVYYTLWHRMEVRGRERIPRDRPCLLAANHASYLDPPAIGAASPLRLRFVAWEGLFGSPLFALLIRSLGAIRISQTEKRGAAAVLRRLIEEIEAGRSVLIFPEGQRSPDGALHPLEGGTALLALKTGAPVVPVRIDGTFEALPPTGRFPLPRKLRIEFRDPIDPADYRDLPDREARAALLERLRRALEPRVGERPSGAGAPPSLPGS